MKKFNKIFAIAAIAAASMFSVQTASAAVQTNDTGIETLLNLKFVDFLGSDWAPLDERIKDNPDKDKLVMLGVAMYQSKIKGTLTDEYYSYLVDEMSKCDDYFYVLLAVMCHE
jgi:dihydrofolate reductase